jgi:hypothetical protein
MLINQLEMEVVPPAKTLCTGTLKLPKKMGSAQDTIIMA